MDIDGVVSDPHRAAAMIAERFTAPVWETPTAAECSARAHAEQAAVADAKMQM
jgi:hypothetical protein